MNNYTRKYLPFGLFALALIIPRLYYVDQYAVPLPFWDQWDAEWMGLLKPWVEGKLGIDHLLVGHNEHRILPTRLMTLFAFWLTGSWNNLVEARLNIPLSALTPLILSWIVFRTEETGRLKWAVIAVIIAGGTLPFAWENFLIGFQSQFYFVNLFTLSSLILAVYFPDKNWSAGLIFLLCLISILTLASGLLTPLAVISVYLTRSYMQSSLTRKTILLILIFLLMSVFAYLTMPRVEGHFNLHATHISEFVSTILRLMGWPLRGSKLHIGVLWLPGLICVTFLLLRRQLSKMDLLMLGCLAWTAMQIAALAYGRGHDSTHMPPRYSEVLLLGLAANSWFVLRLTGIAATPATKNAARVAAVAFFCAVLISYIQRTKNDLIILKEERARRLTQTANVRNYLITRDFSVINKPGFQIPYPDPRRLQKMLDDPGLQRVLVLDRQRSFSN